MHVSSFSQLILEVICIVAIFKKVTGDDKFSCPVSSQTVQVVPDCPVTAEKWQEAATRKNCSMYADKCNEPERLEYHCVINPFINETLEVCAYAQNIVGGHCTEYSISGNLIQWNTNTDCTKFTNPCPSSYLSTETYKYPGCYNLTRRTTTTGVLTSTVNAMMTTPSDASSALPVGGKEDKNDTRWLLILFVFVFPLGGIPIAFILRKRRTQKQRKGIEKIENPETPDNQKVNKRFTEHFIEEDKNEMVPSKKTIASGIQGRKLETFEDPETPEFDLHDRTLTEKKYLINSMNSSLEEFALEQDQHSQEEHLDQKYDNPRFWDSASPNMIRKEIMFIASLLQNIRKKKREKSGEFETENTPLI